MQLQPFFVLRSLLHLSGQLIGAIVAPVHQRVQHRKQSRLLAAAPSSPPALTMSRTPIEVETLQLRETTAPRLEEPPQPEQVLLMSVATPLPDSPNASDNQTERQQIVMGLLDEAYSQGYTTYPALIIYVEQHTGKGCSRRVISSWKKARKLTSPESKVA